ncbi:MAG: ABC-ATPase domain-containing protein [Gemmatimonadota bacterium]|nr:ABC-ATPase domain-containing protein [Gemmatimonadota bacterium]
MSARDTEALRHRLAQIDGAGYKRYKELRGRWRFPDFTLHVDHVQGDPYAAPSPVRVELPAETSELPAEGYGTEPGRLGVAAWLARRFSEAARTVPTRGSGRSGEVRMEHPGQKVEPQTAALCRPDGSVEARFTVGLPGRGRRIAGEQAATLLLDVVPELVRRWLVCHEEDVPELLAAARTNEDAQALRRFLREEDLVAFLADGAMLARASGVEDTPLDSDTAVPFESPESLRATVDLPHAGRISGMPVRPGVTVIVGGGFHGKSTLLRALEAGVYNHMPQDGRERVVTRRDAVKIRAEDGRSVTGVDISSFIDGLPLGRPTHDFTTPNASGSTSQAASIVEAIESEAHVLLIDEDTSATNFMTRDRRMQELVPGAGEPITPFVDRVRSLHGRDDVSTVLVVGGTGDYLDTADTVVRMDTYRPYDVSAHARETARQHPTGRATEGVDAPLRARPRRIRTASLDPSRGRRDTYVRVPDARTLRFGTDTLDLGAVEQITSRAQVRSIGLALAFLARVDEQVLDVAEALDRVEALLEREGLDGLDRRRPGDLAWFRRFELAAALNRLRSLRVGENEEEAGSSEDGTGR